MKRQYTTADTLRPGDVFLNGGAAYTARTVSETTHQVKNGWEIRRKVETVGGPTFYFRENRELEVLA